MFWVYILQNPAGRFYIGHTDDLAGRVRSHNRTDKICGKFTRKNGLWVLLRSEEHPDRSNAMRREREIKSWKSARLIRDRLLKVNDSAVGESRQCRD
jgi:putative endonuclease